MDWSQLNWGNDHLWWVLAAGVAVLTLGLLLLAAWRRRMRRRLGDPALVARLLATVSPGRQALKAVLAVLGVGLVLLTLLRPQYGLREAELTHTGIDMAVLLDASQSMLVRDIAPTRFAAAKREIANVLKRVKGGRASLIPFYFIPFVQAPLTSDFGALEIYLRDLRIQDIADPEMRGTSIGRALAAAVGVLTRDQKQVEAAMAGEDMVHEDDPDHARTFEGSRFKAILLFTDGEEQEAVPEDLIQLAKEANIRIFAVGVGTSAGNAVPSVQDDGEVTGVLKTDGDQPVFSSVNEELLRSLTEATGGEYFRFANRPVAGEVAAALDALEKKEFEARIAELGEDRYPFVLVPAVLLLALEALLSDRRRRRELELMEPLDVG